MTSPQHILKDQSRDLFAQALDLPREQRADFLRQACGDNESLRQVLLQLLQAHAEADGMFRPERAVAEQAGQRIDHYKLLQKIGEGGFGTVWMAEQEEPVRRKVALKVLKAGMDTSQVVGRFEAERQALAMMDHPNIAKVFDGGATPQGRPYFVMELVKGVPITRYCDEAGLGMRERLELFVPVCQAVQHAHQKGVIHRDLKPSNVLVTLHDGKPVPKVIDFGIAKATTGVLTQRTVFTEFQQMLGTPEYMAPEQAELSGLDVDTRADIYSLGVLLYELLTGTRPFELKSLLQCGYAEMLRTIKEVDPPKPSTRISTLGEQLVPVAKHRRVHPRALSALMRGDLDWIVMRALEKERNRRYETATALGEDVLRHLRHEPVQAGPPSRVYRLCKYVRRHQIGVAAGMAIAASLAVGAVASALGYVEASSQAVRARAAEGRADAALSEEKKQKEAALAAQAEAQREASKAKVVLELLTSMLSSSDPEENKGRDYPVRLLLADFEQSLADQEPTEPGVEAALRHMVGASYWGLGMAAAAEPHLLRALELWNGLHGPRHLDVARGLIGCSTLQQHRGRQSEALAFLERAEAALPGDGTTNEVRLRVDLLESRGVVLRSLGRLAQAESVGRDALATAKAGFGEQHRSVANSLACLAKTLLAGGKLSDAERLAREAHEMLVKLLGPDHLQVAESRCTWSSILQQRGDLVGAESLCRPALATKERLLGLQHPKVAAELDHLAQILEQRGELAAAEELCRKALAAYREGAGDGHPGVAETCRHLGMLLLSRGKREEAKGVLVQAVALRRHALASDEPATIERLRELGMLLASLGKLERADSAKMDEAEQLLQQACALAKQANGNELGGALCLHDLAWVQAERGKLDEAETHYREALLLMGQLLDGDHPHALACLNNLGIVLTNSGRLEEAEEIQRALLARTVATLGEKHPQTVTRLVNLLTTLQERKQYQEAAKLGRQALDLTRGLFGNEHELIAIIECQLGAVLRGQGRPAEAEALHRHSMELRRRILGADHKSTGDSERNLGVTLLDLGVLLSNTGKYQEAERRLRESAELAAKHLAATDPSHAAIRFNLGRVLLQQGQLDEADTMLRQALQMLPRDDRPARVSALTELGRLQRRLGRLEEAEGGLRQAVDLASQILADDPANPEAATRLFRSRVWLQTLLEDLGQAAENERAARANLELATRTWGEASEEFAQSLDRLARASSKADKLGDAEQLARRALELRTQQHGVRSVEASTAQLTLARVLLAQQRAADAESLASTCLAIRQEKLAGDWRLHLAQAVLGRAIALQGRAPEAEALLAEACGKMQPPPDSERHLREAIQWLVDLYEADGRRELAAPWRARLPK